MVLRSTSFSRLNYVVLMGKPRGNFTHFERGIERLELRGKTKRPFIPFLEAKWPANIYDLPDNQAAVKLILEGKLSFIYLLFWEKIDARNYLTCFKQVRHHSSVYRIYIDFETTALKWLGRTPISQPYTFSACRIQYPARTWHQDFDGVRNTGLYFAVRLVTKTRRSQGLDRLPRLGLFGCPSLRQMYRQYRFSSFDRAPVIGGDVNPQTTPTQNKLVKTTYEHN